MTQDIAAQKQDAGRIQTRMSLQSTNEAVKEVISKLKPIIKIVSEQGIIGLSSEQAQILSKDDSSFTSQFRTKYEFQLADHAQTAAWEPTAQSLAQFANP